MKYSKQSKYLTLHSTSANTCPQEPDLCKVSSFGCKCVILLSVIPYPVKRQLKHWRFKFRSSTGRPHARNIRIRENNRCMIMMPNFLLKITIKFEFSSTLIGMFYCLPVNILESRFLKA